MAFSITAMQPRLQTRLAPELQACTAALAMALTTEARRCLRACMTTMQWPSESTKAQQCTLLQSLLSMALQWRPQQETAEEALQGSAVYTQEVRTGASGGP